MLKNEKLWKKDTKINCINILGLIEGASCKFSKFDSYLNFDLQL